MAKILERNRAEHVRIDYNFSYLIATKAVANYDLANYFQ